jgi:hypothetical protein
MERRQFIKAGSISVLASSVLLPEVASGAVSSSSVDYVKESERRVPIKGSYDVIVAGAGPAGVSAAIEAGRSGAKTLLLENNGCLGGVWTSGLLTWILDQKNKSGLLREMIDDLKKRDALSLIPTGSSLSFDVEEMKLLLEEYCQGAGVDICLHTRVVGAMCNKKKWLTHIVTESKSGREAWAGKIFIDTTGDGDLAALSGCQFDYGDPENNFAAQPFSLLAMIGGVQFDAIKSFVRWAEDTGSGSKKRLLDLIQRGGFNPSYQNPSIFPIRNDLFMIMVNHEYGLSGANMTDVSKATLHARKEINQVVKALKKTGGAWKDIRVIVTAEQIGIREGRRIHGLYTVTAQDIVDGRRHEDAVCRVTFGIDVHSINKTHENSTGYNRGLKSQSYDIPLRALIAKDVNGLMMAGRCISGDFIAHSSYRVTGNAVVMGQAAGRVAAVAARENVLPQDVSFDRTGL